MLVLSRKKSETIRINDDITVVVVDIKGDKVRIGVEAPKGHSIHRSEIYEKIQSNGNVPKPVEKHANITHNVMSVQDALTLLNYRDYQFGGMERVALANLIRELVAKVGAV